MTATRGTLAWNALDTKPQLSMVEYSFIVVARSLKDTDMRETALTRLYARLTCGICGYTGRCCHRHEARDWRRVAEIWEQLAGGETVTLKEIAARIDAHLKRMEADPKVNAKGTRGTTPFYESQAWDSGRYVGVRYVAYQGDTFLSKADALTYLAWLDAGNNGTHWEALRK